MVMMIYIMKFKDSVVTGGANIGSSSEEGRRSL